MTTQDTLVDGWSLLSFLLDRPGGPVPEPRSDPSAPTGQLGQALARLDVVRAGRIVERLTDQGRRAVDDAVGAAVESLCELDLCALILTGWNRHRSLVDAARSTLDRPGSEAVAELGEHVLSSVHTPTVELLVDNVTVARIPVEVAVELTVRSALLVVRAGHLVELRTGRAELEGRVAVAGTTLVRRRDEVDLPGRLRLRRPWSLLRG